MQKIVFEDYSFCDANEIWAITRIEDPDQPIHVTRTLVQMPLGEIVGYSANLKHNDHLI